MPASIVPQGLLFDTQGDLLISDVGANRIRAVLASAAADFRVAHADEFFREGRRGDHAPAEAHHIESGKRARFHHQRARPQIGW